MGSALAMVRVLVRELPKSTIYIIFVGGFFIDLPEIRQNSILKCSCSVKINFSPTEYLYSLKISNKLKNIKQ